MQQSSDVEHHILQNKILVAKSRKKKSVKSSTVSVPVNTVISLVFTRTPVVPFIIKISLSSSKERLHRVIMDIAIAGIIFHR